MAIPKKATIKKASSGGSGSYTMGEAEEKYILAEMEKLGGAISIDINSAKELFEYTGTAKPDTFIQNAGDFLEKGGYNKFHLGSEAGGKFVKFKPGPRVHRVKKELPPAPKKN